MFLLFFYHKPLFHPNNSLFSNTGDGIKNYFTYAAHIKNNQSATNFEGFNYPYGENFLYTDCHPILVSVLKPLARVFPGIANYSIGLLNLLILLSFVLSVHVLFLLLRAFGVSHFLAAIGALGIVILSPQVFRIQGHLALSYSFCIPLSILLVVRYLRSNNSLKWLGFIFLFHTALLFVHAYLGIISLSIVLAFGVIHLLLNNFPKVKNLRNDVQLLLVSAASIAVYLFLNMLTDSHTNRTNNPYGFFEYYADFDTLLLPNQGPLHDFLIPLFPSFSQTWEGWAYLGIGILVLLPFLGFHFLKTIRNKETSILNTLLFSASIILLFSFGFPFRFFWEEGLEYFPALKQFRAIGRFAWVFYFVIAIYAIVFIDQKAQRIKKPWLQKLVLALLPLLMILEGIPYHQTLSSQITQSANYFEEGQKPEVITYLQSNIKSSDFQAIIPLPFYNIGSENYEKEATGENYLHSMLLSYHTNLPLVSSYLSRISLQESVNIMQLFAPSFYEKTIQKAIPTEKDFLIYYNKNEKLNRHESALLAKATLISEDNKSSYYRLSYQNLFENTANQEWAQFAANSSLTKLGQFWCNDSTPTFHFNSFDLQLNENTFQGEGALTFNKQEQNLIQHFNSALSPNKTYAASIWVARLSENYGQDDLNHLQFTVKEWDVNDKLLQQKSVEVMSSFVHYEDWTLVELEFSPKYINNKVEFSLNGNSPTPKMGIADDFLVREVETNLYQKLPTEKGNPLVLFKNNHRIKSSK